MSYPLCVIFQIGTLPSAKNTVKDSRAYIYIYIKNIDYILIILSSVIYFVKISFGAYFGKNKMHDNQD